MKDKKSIGNASFQRNKKNPSPFTVSPILLEYSDIQGEGRVKDETQHFTYLIY